MATIPAYSVILWALLPGYPLPGPQLGPAVPAGFVWVIREVTACNISASLGFHGTQRLVLEVAGQPIFTTPINGTINGALYELRDGRFVLDAGQQMSVNLIDQNWSLRVSGYQLTA